MIPLGYLVIKRLEETRKKHSLGLVEATSLTSLDEAEPEAEYSLDSGAVYTALQCSHWLYVIAINGIGVLTPLAPS